MASDYGFVEYVCDQLAAAGMITVRKMFGEYCVYCEGKVVALVVNNQLLVKPTAAGLAFYGDGPIGHPFPGAKGWFAVGERLDDTAWITQLIRITEAAVPTPKERKPRVHRPKKD